MNKIIIFLLVSTLYLNICLGCLKEKTTYEILLNKLSESCLDYNIIMSIPIDNKNYIITNTDLYYLTYNKSYKNSKLNYYSFLNKIYKKEIKIKVEELPFYNEILDNEIFLKISNNKSLIEQILSEKVLKVTNFNEQQVFSILHILFNKGTIIIQDNYSGNYQLYNYEDYSCNSYPSKFFNP